MANSGSKGCGVPERRRMSRQPSNLPALRVKRLHESTWAKFEARTARNPTRKCKASLCLLCWRRATKKQDKICRGSPPCIAAQRHRSHTCFPTDISSAYVEGYMRVNTWKKWNLFNTLKIENLDFRPFTFNRWFAQAHPRDPLLKKSWYLFVPNLQRIQID